MDTIPYLRKVTFAIGYEPIAKAVRLTAIDSLTQKHGELVVPVRALPQLRDLLDKVILEHPEHFQPLALDTLG
jgi:hypothetical protein